MPNLNTRTKKVCGFVRDAKKPMTSKELSALRSWFTGLSEQFFLIIHDKDSDPESGEMDISHIHFVADMAKASRLKTFLNAIAEVCGVSSQAVTIERYKYFELSVQYLTHQNEDDTKFKYDASEIVTNVPEDLLIYLSFKPDVFDYNTLCSYLVRCRSISQVMSEIGIRKYHAYRALIRDCWDEYLNGRLFYQGRFYCFGCGGLNSDGRCEKVS